MLTREKLIDAWNDVDDYDEAIELWNNYVDSINDDERHIYYMCDLDTLLDGVYGADVLDEIDLDSFDRNDDYIHYSIYGIQSFCDLCEIADDSELIDWLLDNPEELENTTLSELLDDTEE